MKATEGEETMVHAIGQRGRYRPGDVLYGDGKLGEEERRQDWKVNLGESKGYAGAFIGQCVDREWRFEWTRLGDSWRTRRL